MSNIIVQEAHYYLKTDGTYISRRGGILKTVETDVESAIVHMLDRLDAYNRKTASGQLKTRKDGSKLVAIGFHVNGWLVPFNINTVTIPVLKLALKREGMGGYSSFNRHQLLVHALKHCFN